MTYKDPAAERYRTDPVFATLVDILTSQIQEGNYTPTELREAAILAATRFEMYRTRSILIDPENYSLENSVLESLRRR